MAPLKANTPKQKIKVLILLKKKLIEDRDEYRPSETRHYSGMCGVINDLWWENKIEEEFSLYQLGLTQPKKKYGCFWYEPYKRAPRLANINRTIKRLEKQI